MKFGIFNLMPQRDGSKAASTVFDEAITLVRLAEQIGFDAAWFAEHHFSNYCLCPSPLMMAAHCAAKTTRIRLGTGVIVVPLYQPARLIEEIALVDILSGGRLIVGLGSGYQQYEFDRFGATVADSKKYFMEFLDVMEMAFRDGRYEYEGSMIKLPPTPLAIQPIQNPLPVYVAGLYSDQDVQRRVVETGYVPFATAGWRAASYLAQFKTKYVETATAAGLDPAEMPFAVQRYVFVTPSKDDALRAAEHIRYTARVAQSMRFNYFELDGSLLREIPAKDEPTLQQIVDNAIIGDVDTCIEKAVREIEVLNPSHFSCFMQFGGLDVKQSIRSMELFGERVMPAIADHFGGLDNIGVGREGRAAPRAA
jgi:alkanesulfonate monooxygenase SsuD/methylene tetrahydromethanopterin reductase-like flavin-dependent oxidoreductase (luciferase family)